MRESLKLTIQTRIDQTLDVQRPVVEACNGLEAVEAALREKPQVILMDSRLPFIDGLEATRRIRENGRLDQVKILALNGSGSPRYHSSQPDVRALDHTRCYFVEHSS